MNREVSDGPYLRWLKSIKDAAGERLWETWCESRAPHVDPWIRALGIPPFPDSVEGVRLQKARAKGGESRLVKFVGPETPPSPGAPDTRVFRVSAPEDEP